MKLAKTIYNFTDQLYLNVEQNLASVMNTPAYFYSSWLNITMLSDNSIYMFWSMSPYNIRTNVPTSVYDRNFTQFADANLTYNLTDVLTINADPFYLEIHQPGNASQVLWSTKNQRQFLHVDFNVFTYTQPSAHPERFFGLQERKGNFFLQDNYMYSLYNNDNNVPDLKQANGRVVQHGKNGNFPVVMSKLNQSSNLTAVITFNSYGSDYVFQALTPSGPAITQISPLSLVEQIILFNMTPVETSKAIANHVTIGDLNKYPGQQAFDLPPYDFTFGWFPSVRGYQNDQEIMKLIDMYQKWKWPIEGIVFNLELTDNFTSFTYSPEKFANITDTLYYLKSNNMSHFTVMKSGFSYHDNSTY